MSSVDVAECTCVNWAGDDKVRQCPTHFHLFRGSTRLTSVGRIVAHSFPLDPSVPESVLENARDRGSVVDRLFADYVRGALTAIPSGTRRDAVDLFFKLQKWYDRQKFKTVEVQVLLAGKDHAGIVDFIFDDIPHDLKCTYNIEHSARLQVAGYSALANRDGRIIHATERFVEPKVVPLKGEDHHDWLVVLDHWRMLQSRDKV